MKNRILLLFIIAFSAFNGMAQGGNTGEFYLEELQYQKAHDLLLKNHQANPGDIKVCGLLGDVFIELNKLDSAKIMYQKAFSVEPKNAFVLVNMGKIALLQGDRQSELDYFDKAKKADKKNPAIYCEIAKSCLTLAKKDTATGHSFLNQGLNLNSKYPGFHMVLGDWEAYKKNYGKAANNYENAIFFDKTNALAYRKLGEIYADARFNKQSLDKYNESIRINPNQILVYKRLGDLFYTLGRYAEAEQNYKIYMSKADVSLDDKEKYAIILFFLKKYTESASVLEDVLHQNADESVLLRIRGYIAYETGEFAKGLDYMKKFFQLHDPNKIIVLDYLYYGRLLEKNNMDMEAMDNFNKALAMDSTKTEVYGNLASLAAKNNMRPQAIQYYNKMIQKGADKLTTYFAIGMQAYREGLSIMQKYDTLMNLQKKENKPFSDSTVVRDSMLMWYTKADSAFAMVTRLDPTYATGYWLKGRMDNYLDPEVERSEAKESYEKALAIYEKDVEKNKDKIIECYHYLAWYNFANSEKIKDSDKQKATELMNNAKEIYNKILQLDPNDAMSLKVIDALNQQEKAEKQAKKPVKK